MKNLSKNKEGNAIILGANHHNTYGIIRSLHNIGISPIVITTKLDDLCCYKGSRYVKELIELPPEEILDYLIHRKDLKEGKDTLYVSSDYFSNLVDKNTNILSAHYNLPGAKGKLDKWMDKQAMAKLAEKNGLRIPPNSLVKKTKNLMEYSSVVNFPCIIKPSKSIAGRKSDIYICHNKIEFETIIPQLHCEEVQIQDYIIKDYEYQLIGLSLPDNEIIIPGITRLLWAASPRTNTGIVKTFSIQPNDKITILAVKKFIHEIGYVGSFSVEFIRDRNGNDFFMEINFRNDGNAIVMTKSGINLPAIWWNYFSCKKNQHLVKLKSSIAIPLRNMIAVARNEKKRLELIKYCIKPGVFMDVDFLDLYPLYSQIKSKTIRILKNNDKTFHHNS